MDHSMCVYHRRAYPQCGNATLQRLNTSQAFDEVACIDLTTVDDGDDDAEDIGQLPGTDLAPQ